MKRFLAHELKKLSLELVLLITLFIVCLFVLLYMADIVFYEKSAVFDDYIFSLFQPCVNSSNTKIMSVVTFFGSVQFLLPANILLSALFLFTKSYKWHSIKIAAISITSTIVLFSLKEILRRERPMLPVIAKVHGYSFPSGHSFSSLVFYGMLAYIAYAGINNKTGRTVTIIFLIAFALMIGISRVYLKVHFASDVVAGWCLGIIWLLLGRWLLISTEKSVDRNYTPSIKPTERE